MSVFKPKAEELRDVMLNGGGCEYGEVYLKEMTMYLLDCYHNHFSRVPVTALFSTSILKYDSRIKPMEAEGSIQKYVPNVGDFFNRGTWSPSI